MEFVRGEIRIQVYDGSTNLPPATADGKVFHAGTRIDANGDIRADGGRVLCAVGLGADLAEARERAYAMADSIAWDAAYYRRDIGFKALRRDRD